MRKISAVISSNFEMAVAAAMARTGNTSIPAQVAWAVSPPQFCQQQLSSTTCSTAPAAILRQSTTSSSNSPAPLSATSIQSEVKFKAVTLQRPIAVVQVTPQFIATEDKEYIRPR